MIDEPCQATDRAIADGREVIFEAMACFPDGAFLHIDILKKDGLANRWDLIEIKQSTAAKDYHIDDITLQRCAFAGAGDDVERPVLMHLNRHYVRQGAIDPLRIFLMEDCTDLPSSRRGDESAIAIIGGSLPLF